MAVIENRYAEALMKTAIEKNAVSEYENELEDLRSLVCSEELKDVLDHPNLNCTAKKKLIKEILGDKFVDNIKNFYLILLDSGRYRCINAIVSSYKKMADEYRKISNIKIISASELSDEEVKRITDKIEKQYNLSNIKVERIIDASIIGGIIVKIGDTIIDGTIKERLNKLKSAILN